MIAVRAMLQYVSQHCPGPNIIYTSAQGGSLLHYEHITRLIEYGAVISECQQLLLHRHDVVVVWVRRLNNICIL